MNVRYTKAPMLHISYNCGGKSCRIDTVQHDGDSFVCSDCMTSWLDDGDEGQTYEEWNGEDDRDGAGEAVDPDRYPTYRKARAEEEKA